MEDQAILSQCLSSIFKVNAADIEKQQSLINDKFETYVPSEIPGTYNELEVHYKDISMRARKRVDIGNIWLTLYGNKTNDGKKIMPGMYFFTWVKDYTGELIKLDAVHPHISGGNPCLGGFEGRLVELYSKGAVLPWLLMIGKFLNTWYLDSSYWNINRMRRIYGDANHSKDNVLLKGIEAEKVRQHVARVGPAFGEKDIRLICQYSKKMKMSSYAVAQSISNIKYVCTEIVRGSLRKSKEWRAYQDIMIQLGSYHSDGYQMGRNAGNFKPTTPTKLRITQCYDLLTIFINRSSAVLWYTKKVFEDDFDTFFAIFMDSPDNAIGAIRENNKFAYLSDLSLWKTAATKQSKTMHVFTDEVGTVKQELHEVRDPEEYYDIMRQGKYEAMLAYDKYLTREIRRVHNAISNTNKSGIQTDLFAGSVQQ